MKTQKILAVILCIATLFSLSATSSFAYERNDIVEWEFVDNHYDDYTEEYVYGGKISEGSTDIEDFNDYYHICYEFDASKAGYYMLSFCPSEIWLCFAETYTNGTPVNYADYLDWYDEDQASYLFYLPEGTALLGADFNAQNFAATSITIEYYAEAINDVTYDKSIFENLIINYDIDTYENKFWLTEDYTVIFSNGKTLEYKYNEVESSLECSFEGELVNGENEITIHFPGFEKQETLTAYYITHYVESIEINNLDRYLNGYEYYNGRYGYYEIENGETVTVNFTDGTSKTMNYYYNGYEDENTYVELPNGREYHIYSYHTQNDKKEQIFIVGMAEHLFIEKKCNIVKADISSNADYLKENIEYNTYFFMNEVECWLSLMPQAETPEEFMYFAKNLFESTKFIKNIFTEISEFISFCF